MATSVSVRGLDEATRRIGELSGRLSDLSPALRPAAEDLKTLIDDSFRESRSPDGTPWAPLKPATIKRRRQGSSKPLVDTGTLRNSISVRAGKKTLRVGTNVPYAGTHQFGGEHIPARPFLPISGGTGGHSLMTGGPAGAEIEAIRRAIIEYIRTGRVT